MFKSFTHVEHKEFDHGKLIKDKEVNIEYNGENMEIDVRDQDKEKHVTLTNKELLDVFSKPMHQLNLMKRLSMDFKETKSEKQKEMKKPEEKKKAIEMKKPEEMKKALEVKKTKSTKGKSKKSKTVKISTK